MRLLGPPRAQWFQVWDPRTGRTIWQCVGAPCPVHVTSMGLGCASGCGCKGARGLGAQGLGADCPSCYFPVGSQCVACPEGSTLPECSECRGGVPTTSPTPWYERPVAGPIIVGLVSAVTLGIAIPLVRKQLGRVGVRLE